MEACWGVNVNRKDCQLITRRGLEESPDVARQNDSEPVSNTKGRHTGLDDTILLLKPDKSYSPNAVN